MACAERDQAEARRNAVLALTSNRCASCAAFSANCANSPVTAAQARTPRPYRPRPVASASTRSRALVGPPTGTVPQPRARRTARGLDTSPGRRDASDRLRQQLESVG